MSDKQKKINKFKTIMYWAYTGVTIMAVLYTGIKGLFTLKNELFYGILIMICSGSMGICLAGDNELGSVSIYELIKMYLYCTYPIFVCIFIFFIP